VAEEAKITLPRWLGDLPVRRKERTVSHVNVIRAWKDAEYRRSLMDEQRARVPAHPSGAIEFQDRGSEESRADSLYHGCSPCHRCMSGGNAP
jgi:mersacidin/lichenicidin family type 2 lantibiotic